MSSLCWGLVVRKRFQCCSLLLDMCIEAVWAGYSLVKATEKARIVSCVHWYLPGARSYHGTEGVLPLDLAALVDLRWDPASFGVPGVMFTLV